MRRIAFVGCATLLGLTLVLARPGFADDQDSTKSNESHTTNKPVGGQDGKSAISARTDAAKSAKPRLPVGWGKLGLSTDQHEKVLAVMVKFAPQMQQLEAQLAELRAKQHTEMAAVLTPDQKSQLAEVEAAKKTQSERDGAGSRRRRMRFSRQPQPQ